MKKGKAISKADATEINLNNQIAELKAENDENLTIMHSLKEKIFKELANTRISEKQRCRERWWIMSTINCANCNYDCKGRGAINVLTCCDFFTPITVAEFDKVQAELDKYRVMPERRKNEPIQSKQNR